MREFDIVVWGATGFTGKLVCEHIAKNYQGALRWAIAGRNQQKLQKVREELSQVFPTCKDVPILIADIDKPGSMEKVAAASKVVLSTAGPYISVGTPVVRACIATGTHYADINGELEWMKQTIEEFHEPAGKAGVKIVHCCGWDCAPSDLGVLFLTKHAEKVLGRKMAKVTNVVTEIAGAFSGGSLNTALGFYANPSQGLFPHPYSLNPAGSRSGKDKQQFLGAWYEPLSKTYTSPSFFAPADMRIVRRSNFLLGNAYGADFMFDEAFGHKSMVTAVMNTLSLWLMGIFLYLVAHWPLLTRWLKRTSMKPGEGPTRKFMDEGHWKCEIVGTTVSDSKGRQQRLKAVLKGQGDPGYSQTSRMLLEAGMCLLGGQASPYCVKGGVLTPAAGLGEALIDRFRKAGISFDIIGTSNDSVDEKQNPKAA